MITATPPSGYQFSGFTGSVNSSSNPLTITMNSAMTVTANFTPTSTSYTLTNTVNPSGGGTTSPSCPSGCSYASGSQVTITATPGSGYQFTGFTGSVSSNSNPLTVIMNSATTETANFVATSEYTATTIEDLRNCIQNLTQFTICTLAPSPNPYYVTAPIDINRSNIVVRGGTSGMNDTKLARDPSFTGDLIRIGQNASVSGVALKYLTVCGASNITPNWGPAPPSPVACPRVQTVCGDRSRFATEHPDEPNQLPQCVDISVMRSALPVFPLDPFNSPPASYAVEFDHVDLEDATGHALSLYVYNGNHIEDIYFHDGAINYSGVTGILIGGADYSRKFCDGYADQLLGFANDRNVNAPRNIRVEHNQFTENRTGVTGGLGRWIGFRSNTFTRNYIWPQAQGGAVPGTNPPVGDPNESCGGTLEFNQCADQIQVMNNSTFTGPGSDHRCTAALEMYGRNITVDTNSISGYQLQGVVAHSLKQATIRNNTITFAAPSDPPDGGITVTTIGAGGACTDSPLNIYRESKDISISGNTISGKHYGVNLAEHSYRSTGAIHNLTIGSNYGNWSTAQYWQDTFVWANTYNGYNGPLTTTPILPSLGFGVTPRVLPVDAESGSTRALCSMPGAARASFTFAASDDSNGSANMPGYNPRLDYGAAGYAGAAQVLFLEGTFSNASPPGGPSNTIQDCHFYYAADANVVYLDDGTGTWGYGSSALGAGGYDLTNPSGCIIHAASSSGSAVLPGQYARSVTLDVEFLGSSVKKYIYAYTMNKNGTVSYADYDQNPQLIWQYWGWWQKP